MAGQNVGIEFVIARPMDAGEREYLERRYRHELALGLLDQLEIGHIYTVEISRQVSQNFDDQPGMWPIPDTKIRLMAKVQECCSHQVVVFRPPTVDEMPWPKLMKSATREVWDRVKGWFRWRR